MILETVGYEMGFSLTPPPLRTLFTMWPTFEYACGREIINDHSNERHDCTLLSLLLVKEMDFDNFSTTNVTTFMHCRNTHKITDSLICLSIDNIYNRDLSGSRLIKIKKILRKANKILIVISPHVAKTLDVTKCTSSVYLKS